MSGIQVHIRISVIILLCFIASGMFLQEALAQESSLDSVGKDAVYIADARIQVHDLLEYTSIFVDSSNSLTLQEIGTEKFRNRFQSLSDFNQLAQPYITYWLKVTITASGNINDWWLVLSGIQESETIPYQHSYVDAYFLDSLQVVTTHQRTGVSVPRSQKTIKQNPGLNRVLFSAKDKETLIVYVRIYNEYGQAAISAPHLRNPVVGISDQKQGTLFNVLAGAVFLFSIVLFFLFFFVREKAYLFFGIYALILSHIYLVIHPDHPFLDIYIPEHPQFTAPVFLLLTQGGFIFFILFGRYFINLPQLSKKLDTILLWYVAAWVLSILINVVFMMITHKAPGFQIGYAFLALFIVFLIRIVFFKSVLVHFYVAGALWLVCFSILGLFWNELFLTLPFNPWPVGQVGQLLIYISGLAYKVRLNEQARVHAEVVKLRNVELASLYNESTKQKEEIELQKKSLEGTLADLRSTQSQLIQSEKMASLGELTAGIAHEIQNPLNFVNNFSEVNSELITELKQEIDHGNFDEVKKIANNINENEQKIIFHGKRADGIVKGMLQHSRSSSGTKEPTDINALTDEYVRLAYHGLRAKDKSFNAMIKTDFDESIGLVDVIPQDIGRAILNLITNAFYAVTEKKKLFESSLSLRNEGKMYEPIVFVTTKKFSHPLTGMGESGRGPSVLIHVKDNGIGIPQSALDKIFQPFFTTKPTGQGTGLGLSLSYDIIKAHGGELKVNTKEGDGTEFIIILPI